MKKSNFLCFDTETGGLDPTQNVLCNPMLYHILQR